MGDKISGYPLLPSPIQVGDLLDVTRELSPGVFGTYAAVFSDLPGAVADSLASTLAIGAATNEIPITSNDTFSSASILNGTVDIKYETGSILNRLELTPIVVSLAFSDGAQTGQLFFDTGAGSFIHSVALSIDSPKVFLNHGSLQNPDSLSSLFLDASGQLSLSTDGISGSESGIILSPTQASIYSVDGLAELKASAFDITHSTLIRFNTAPVRFNALTASTIPYLDASKNLTSITTGSNGQVLTLSGGLPVWVTPSAGATVFSDSVFRIQDNGDATKQLAFEVSGITSATTRTLTVQDASGTIAITSNKLSVFAATTSAELAGVISDETGSGSLVFGTSPTIVTPTIASFTNATHNHQNAAGGGQLDLTLAVAGILPSGNGGTGINNAGRTLAVNLNSGTLAFTMASSTLTIPQTGTAALTTASSNTYLAVYSDTVTVGGTAALTYSSPVLTNSVSSTGITLINSININAGTGSRARVSAENGAISINMTAFGTGFTPAGLLLPSLTALTSTSTTGILYNSSAGSTAHIWTIGGSALANEYLRLTTTALTLADAVNIVTGTTTGSIVFATTAQKGAFWGKAPIIQPASANQAALTNSTGGTYNGTLVDVGVVFSQANINDNFTDLFTLQDAMRTALVNAGIMKGAA